MGGATLWAEIRDYVKWRKWATHRPSLFSFSWLQHSFLKLHHCKSPAIMDHTLVLCAKTNLLLCSGCFIPATGMGNEMKIVLRSGKPDHVVLSPLKLFYWWNVEVLDTLCLLYKIPACLRKNWVSHSGESIEDIDAENNVDNGGLAHKASESKDSSFRSYNMIFLTEIWLSFI